MEHLKGIAFPGKCMIFMDGSEENNQAARRVIKRYQNRKLYDTRESRYITLEEIAILVRSGEDVQIVDNTTKEDLTSITLTQILVEQEKKHKKVPLSALKDFIHGKGGSVADFLRDKVGPQVSSFKGEAERALEDVQKKVDERLRNMMERITVVSEMRDEVRSLKARVEHLEAKLGGPPNP